MKRILIIAFTLLIIGCGNKTIIVKEAVWTPPQFEIPKRPVLVSDGVGTDGEIARKNSDDLILMRGYAFQLETLLASVKAQSGIPSTTLKKTEINK